MARTSEPAALAGLRRRGLAARTGAYITAACVMVAACGEGYPTADTPPFEPSRMSQTERVRHLNELGAAAGAGGRWRYALDERCVLRVERKACWQRGVHSEVALPTATIRTSFDSTTETFSVLAGLPRTEAVPLFQSKGRLDAMRAELLLAHVRSECLSAADEKETPK